MTNVIQLRAKAKVAGIEGYKTMTASELEGALKASGGRKTTAPSPNGSGRKTGTGRKTATPAAKPAAATGRKQASGAKKPPAAKSETGEAKRASSGARKTTTPKADKPKAAKPAAAKPATAKRTPKVDADAPGRAGIDNKNVDWKAETTIGKAPGPRQDIMKGLRKFNGNKEKVFTALKEAATAMYPKNKRTGERYLKAKSLELLRWHIGRVAFDFVVATGQHSVSTNRAAYGSSTNPQAIKRREARNGGSTATSGRKSATTGSGAKKSTPARKPAQTPARKPTQAKKPAAAKPAPTTGRKTAAARKR